jgi:hypothetical protein
MIKLVENGSISAQSFPSLESLAKSEPFISSHWEQKAFAIKLKEIAAILTNIPNYKFGLQEFKKTNLPSDWNVNGESMSVRTLLQKLGTEAMRDNVHENVWVNALFSDYAPGLQWLITDTRFLNEAKAIEDRGGILIRVNRGDQSSDGLHSSETALDNYPYHYAVTNDGTLEELEDQVKGVLIAEKLL